MEFTDSLGQAFLLYNNYVREVEKSNNKPVSFFKFLIGKR